MRLFGLIGYPLTHSFSPTYFAEKFYKEGISHADYQAFPLEKIDDFPQLLKKHHHLQGLNVTIPYKESVLPYLQKIDAEAQEVGAVNTIKITPEGLVGYNTDVYGFEQSLRPLLKKHHQKALILGTGGASKAVQYVLERKLAINCKLVSRNPKEGQFGYNDLDEKIIGEHTLVVNTTPLGMYPKENDFPAIPYKFVGEKHLFYDLIYNPEKTIFLIKGKLKEAAFKNGWEMLLLQAEKAWEIWNE